MGRDNKEVTLKESIENLLNTYKLKGKVNEVQINQLWHTIVGKTISNATQEIFLKGDTLYIRLNNPSVKNELVYMNEQIRDRINSEMGSRIVSKLVFL